MCARVWDIGVGVWRGRGAAAGGRRNRETQPASGLGAHHPQHPGLQAGQCPRPQGSLSHLALASLPTKLQGSSRGQDQDLRGPPQPAAPPGPQGEMARVTGESRGRVPAPAVASAACRHTGGTPTGSSPGRRAPGQCAGGGPATEHLALGGGGHTLKHFWGKSAMCHLLLK